MARAHNVGETCIEKCKTCKRNLVVTSKDYAGCPKGHGRLTQVFAVDKDGKGKK